MVGLGEWTGWAGVLGGRVGGDGRGRVGDVCTPGHAHDPPHSTPSDPRPSDPRPSDPRPSDPRPSNPRPPALRACPTG